MTLKESKSRHTSLLLFLNLITCPNFEPYSHFLSHLITDTANTPALFRMMSGNFAPISTAYFVLDNNYDEVLVRKMQGKILLSQI